MTDKAKIWELISDQLNEEEAIEVLNEINSSGELKKQYKDLQRVWSLTGGEEYFTDEEIEDRLRKFEINRFNISGKKRIGQYLLATLKYAAIFILAFILSWYMLNEDQSSSVAKLNTKNLIFETLQKQVAKVTLADGSVVWLNSSSKLEVPESFTNLNKRDVVLTGEALFEVTKDSLKPFSVHTLKGAVVRVLGTKFDIDAYADDKVITTLLEGSVEVRSMKELLTVLHPGEQAVYYTSSGVVEVNKYEDKNITIWKEDVLTFKDEELSSIVPKLEKFYHVSIEVDNEKMNKQRLSGRAFRSYTVEQVLDVFRLVSNMKYKVIVDDKGKKTIHIY